MSKLVIKEPLQEALALAKESLSRLLSNVIIRKYQLSGNATQSAIKAGYSKKTATEAGSRLLTFVKVKEPLKEAEKEAEKQLNVSRQAQFDKYEEAFNLAREQRNPANMVQAVKAENQMLGYKKGVTDNTNKNEVSIKEFQELYEEL